MAEKPDVSKLDKVLEGYKPIPMKRLFYPRGMKLSEQFINAFHREYDRLLGEGQNPKTLVERFGKAMKFHKNESRKYHQLDEEKATRELEEKKQQWDKTSKQYFTPVNRSKGCKNEKSLRAEERTGKKKVNEASEWKKRREAEKVKNRESDKERTAWVAKKKAEKGDKVAINPLTDKAM
tara:strand:+ start:1986 stop:2522 length:537 start_codon:yes stop_codon:yes gene_type:complete